MSDDWERTIEGERVIHKKKERPAAQGAPQSRNAYRRPRFRAERLADFFALRAGRRAAFLAAFLAPFLAAFLADFLAAFLAAFLGAFLAFFAAGRAAFFAGLRGRSGFGAVWLDWGAAAGVAGEAGEAGVGSTGSGSIHPEPDQPISM
jgi:hypothetical protein